MAVFCYIISHLLKIIQIDIGSYRADSLVALHRPTPHTNDGVLLVKLLTTAEEIYYEGSPRTQAMLGRPLADNLFLFVD